jgi:hypothetical protein
LHHEQATYENTREQDAEGQNEKRRLVTLEQRANCLGGAQGDKATECSNQRANDPRPQVERFHGEQF